jgi:hypothetical protein
MTAKPARERPAPADPVPVAAAALIEEAIRAIPNLTEYGVGLYQPSKASASESIAAGQAKLRAAVHEVALCADWLASIGATKSVTRGAGSYGCKHLVEHWLAQQGRLDYIPNGAFIAAAVGTGRYPFAITGVNVSFGFSAKDLRRARLCAAPGAPGSIAGAAVIVGGTRTAGKPAAAVRHGERRAAGDE